MKYLNGRMVMVGDYVVVCTYPLKLKKVGLVVLVTARKCEVLLPNRIVPVLVKNEHAMLRADDAWNYATIARNATTARKAAAAVIAHHDLHEQQEGNATAAPVWSPLPQGSASRAARTPLPPPPPTQGEEPPGQS